MKSVHSPSRPVTRGLSLLCAALAALLGVAAYSGAPTARARAASPSATPEPTPGPPVKIVFDPPAANLLPGRPVTVTATALDEKNREVKCGTFGYELADESHKNFVMLRSDDEDCGGGQKAVGKRLVLVAVFDDEKPAAGPGPARPSAVPVIVNFKKGEANVRKVLNVGLTDGGRAPGPVPPGLKPQVDVMWSVLPSDIVHNSFGRKVQGDFYGIQIVIGNNSGHDLQLASAGFTLKEPVTSPSGAKFPLPAASYNLARASLVRQQETGPRAIIVNSLDALGPVLTGFVPFFHVLNRRANFSQFVNILTNPFSEGVRLVAPDTTIGHLGRLEQQTIRNDNTTRTIIPNNTQVPLVTFFPKRTLRDYMVRIGYNKEDTKDPLKVMEALGDLVIVGHQVEYLNRVRLVGDTERRETATVSGRVTDGCNKGVADVKVKLTGGPFFKETEVTTNADGVYLFQNVPTGDDYKVTAKKDPLNLVSEGGDAFRLEDDRANVNFRVREEKRSISGKVTDAEGKAIAGVTVKVSDAKKVTTNEQGAYSITGLEPVTFDVSVEKAGVTFTGDNKTRKNVSVTDCSQAGVNFTGSKAPAATPTPTPTP